MTHFIRFNTALGPVFATAAGDSLTGIYFEGQRHAPEISREWREDPKHKALAECARQVAAYSHQGISRAHPLLSATLPDGTTTCERITRLSELGPSVPVMSIESVS